MKQHRTYLFRRQIAIERMPVSRIQRVLHLPEERVLGEIQYNVTDKRWRFRRGNRGAWQVLPRGTTRLDAAQHLASGLVDFT